MVFRVSSNLALAFKHIISTRTHLCHLEGLHLLSQASGRVYTLVLWLGHLRLFWILAPFWKSDESCGSSSYRNIHMHIITLPFTIILGSFWTLSRQSINSFTHSVSIYWASVQSLKKSLGARGRAMNKAETHPWLLGPEVRWTREMVNEWVDSVVY